MWLFVLLLGSVDEVVLQCTTLSLYFTMFSWLPVVTPCRFFPSPPRFLSTLSQDMYLILSKVVYVYLYLATTLVITRTSPLTYMLMVVVRAIIDDAVIEDIEAGDSSCCPLIPLVRFPLAIATPSPSPSLFPLAVVKITAAAVVVVAAAAAAGTAGPAAPIPPLLVAQRELL